MMSDDYPAWICADCGKAHGRRPGGNPHGATWHWDTCGICGNEDECTEPRDYGHLKPGWEPRALAAKGETP